MASLSSYGTRNSGHSQLVFQWSLVGLGQARVYQGRKFWLCRRNHFTHGSVQQLENTQTRPRTCSSGLHKDWCDLPAGVTFCDSLPNLNYGLLKQKWKWNTKEEMVGMPKKQEKDFQMGSVIILPLADCFTTQVQQSFRFNGSYLLIELTDQLRL